MTATAKLGIEITVDDAGVVKISNIGDQAVKAGDKAEKGFKKAGTAASGFKGIVGEVGDKIKEFGPLIATYFGGQAIDGIIGLADEMLSLRGQVAAATDSAAEYNVVQELLYAQSKDNFSSLQTSSDAYAALHLSLRDTTDAASTSLTVVDNLNKTLLKSNASTHDAASFWLQLKQSVSSATVQWEELGPMLEANRDFAARLADAFDTTTGGLKEMTSTGQLSGKQLIEAIKGMTASINADMDSIPLTVDKAKTQISNAFAKIISDADAVNGGTSSLAEGMSGLADVIESNAPAIQAMFSAIITGAEIGVKGISALEGTFKAVAAAILGMTAEAVESATWWVELSNEIGLTDIATESWANTVDAANASALDLANQSNEAFQRMRGELDQGIGKEAEYKAALEANLASIEADKAAQTSRADTTVAGIDRITAAEKKASEERQATVAEMYATLGVGGEEYFRHEAQKLLDQAAKWEEAGADQIATQQYLYEEITALSAQAWEAQDQGAGMYLDGLTASFTSATAAITDDISTINEQEINIPADLYTEPAEQSISYVDSEVARLSTTPAVVEIGGDNSGFLDAVAEASDAMDSLTAGLTGSVSVDTESFEEMREMIAYLDETPTMDPFHEERDRLQKLVDKYIDENRDELDTSYAIDMSWMNRSLRSFDGGGFTGSMPRSGGTDGKGGFTAILHPQETVIDHTKPGNQMTDNPTSQVVNNNSSVTNNSNVTVNVQQALTNNELTNLIERQKIENNRAIPS